MVNLVSKKREDLKITQAKLAEAVGIGRSTLSDIETGKCIPSVNIAIKIAKALHCSVEDIFKP